MTDDKIKDAVTSFNAKGYITAANEASKRTRTVMIVLVVATVIFLVGFYNSLDGAWMLQRIRAAYSPSSHYSDMKLHAGPEMHGSMPASPGPAEEFQKQFQEALVKAYVDNTFFVKAPFFGIVFDINDVGLIGGISLICVLVMLRFSLSREIKNLNFVFNEAVVHGQLPDFYYELSMHQVLTIPEMRGEKRNRKLELAPQIVCLFPAIVYMLGILYDYVTIFWMKLFDWRSNILLITFEFLFFIAIASLSRRCRERLRHINGIWDNYWLRMGGIRSRVILLEPELVKDFGEDELANKALKEFVRAKSENVGRDDTMPTGSGTVPPRQESAAIPQPRKANRRKH
jgi:hypothetical protein